jgi:sterol 3beta-glucosyltransferase
VKIVVTTGGTLGDIVPFCAIANVLSGRGHDVVVATSPDYQVLVESLGLRFAKVGESFRALIETPLGRAWNSTESSSVYMKLTRELLVPLMAATTADMRGAVMDADLVLFHPFNLGAYHTAEARGIKAVLLAMVPWAVSGEIEPVFVPGAPRIAWLRRVLTKAMFGSFCDLFREGHDAHRASIGLSPFREKNYFAEILAKGVPLLHLFSPSLVPRPSDWPKGAEVMGFCDLIGQDADFVPSAELTRFLDEGDPPLYVGFGSTTGDKPEALNPIVFGALERLGRRAIVAGGWCGLGNDGSPTPSEGRRANKNVFQIPYVPHTWLFPRVSAVVHHGSTGSLAAGLKAGRPTLVIPFFGDQGFWGTRAFASGVGPRPVRRRGLTAKRFATALDNVTGDPRYREAAAMLAGKLAAEDGASSTVAYVEKFVGIKK